MVGKEIVKWTIDDVDGKYHDIIIEDAMYISYHSPLPTLSPVMVQTREG